MKMEKSELLLMALITITLTAVSALAQPPDTLWTKVLGGGSDDFCYAIQQTSDGNLALFGTTSSWGAGGENGWVVKMDNLGNVLWNHQYGGNERNLAWDGQQTTDGGYVLAGQIGDYPAADAWLVKANGVGTQLWSQSYTYSSHDHAESVCQTADGGYILTGNHDGGLYNIWTVKTDPNGDMIWNHEYPESGNNTGFDVLQTGDGGYLMLCTIHVESWNYNPRIRLIKTDAAGVTQWSHDYGGSNWANGRSVQLTTDGGYIFTGWTGSPGGIDDVWLVKIDASGQVQWDRTFGGSNNDEGYNVQLTQDGGYVIAGYTVPPGSTHSDMWIIKTDSSGDMEWDLTYGGSNDEEGRCVDQTSDGGFIVGGYTNSFGAGGYDAYLVRLAPEQPPPDMSLTLVPFVYPLQIPASGGSFDFYCFVTNNETDTIMADLWTKVILPNGSSLGPLMGPAQVLLNPGTTGWYRSQNVPGHAPAGSYTYMGNLGVYPNSIWASDSFQFVKAAGGDRSGIGDWSNWGETFDSPLPAAASHPTYPYLHEPVPNPFNPTTAVRFQLSVDNHVDLKVFNISGRTVATLVDGWREAGMHEVTFDGSGLPSGIYIYRLETGDFTASGKMVLMK
jgi:hypothetical protein